MHKLMPVRAGTDKRLCHKLMEVLRFLIWVRITVTVLLNGSATYGLYVVVNISTNSTGEASDHARANKFKPVVFWMQWSLSDGQTGWPLRLSYVHNIQCAS